MPELQWAEVLSANGMIADSARRSLFVNQTFTAAAIQRVPFDDPGAAKTYYAAPATDAAAGFDGLTRGDHNHLFAAANGAAQVWRIDGPHKACSLADHGSFANGPSDLAFGRKGTAFKPRDLFVTSFAGDLLQLVDARG